MTTLANLLVAFRILATDPGPKVKLVLLSSSRCERDAESAISRLGGFPDGARDFFADDKTSFAVCPTFPQVYLASMKC